MAARDTALAALIACRKQNAWSDGVLKEYIVRDRLDPRDAALASRLCYGVLQNRMLLDFYIAAYLRGGTRRVEPIVLDILRLGTYQLTMSDRIPDSAAVNEAVEQAKRFGKRPSANLVNAVLRTIAREKQHLPVPPDMATRWSHPQALIDLLRENIGGEKLEALLAADNEAPATVIQINPLRTSAAALRQELEALGIECTGHPWMKGCFFLAGTGNVSHLDAFREGKFYVQDPAARLAAMCAEVKPGMQVLDSCAAPGGKSFACAIEMENRGRVLACDLHAHKIALIAAGAERLGLSCVEAIGQDARDEVPQWRRQMDAVLVDAPCSGLGVIRKKPDIRYKELTQTGKLPALQLELLRRQAEYVKLGGVLLYCTCTLLRRENQDVVQQFLQGNEDFGLERLTLPKEVPEDTPGMTTLLPCDTGTDGFFICKMRRNH